jgi:hypothetical protein
VPANVSPGEEGLVDHGECDGDVLLVICIMPTLLANEGAGEEQEAPLETWASGALSHVG